MFTLSGFADEVSEDLDVQLDTFQRLGIQHIEFRGVWGKNVLDLTDEQVKKVKSALTKRGMKVSAIGSPIGKIGIEDPFEPHLDRFVRAIDLAEFFGCRYIRIFSFFVPEGEADDYRPEVIDRLGTLLDMVEGHPVVLLHENERHIYGDIPRRCADIFESLPSPQLRMTFDPANFVICGVRPFTEGYELLKDYIDYVHIKDALLVEQKVVPAGEGDGEVEKLLRALKARNYDGFLSLEPHLAMAGESRGWSGPELFERATDALNAILAKV
jgi:sugar phosphate isomerase/epimerase